ncbi:TBC1 domain family member 25 [Alligator sinensis]|uniref:TBC1 domain family member 25 n=1 Tax=Alligator sinensis TaxID=38654 RepID=A0A3Q0HBN0_ALLSI|nr:TBC1 domain family member 25 [Alligator sinensis]
MAAPSAGGSQGGTEDEHEVVRVRVKKCEGLLPPEYRSFAVDPQITSFDVLQHILVRAFDLGGKKSFGISYMGRDRQGQDTWFPLLSDGDLGVAFTGASCPHLQLRVDIRTAEDSPLLEDWDIISPKDVVGSEPLPGERRSLAAAALPLTQAILSQVGRTLWRVQQALSWTGGEETPAPAPPLNEAEFHALLSPDGRLARPEDLRLRVYHGGVEPSLRKVVRRHLLTVSPVGLTAPQRLAYVRRKAREYEVLKQAAPGRAPGPEDAAFVRAAVAKDVARTDRAQPYYAGPDDGPRLRALEDLLVTYALAHPRVSYCQGMSDLASPLLAVLDDEAQAYVCFCGLMKRLEGNFLPDGRALGLKFAHLRLLLRRLDPPFHAYLAARGADDLFFCYRWLLLELKREFAFEDALRVLEVLWSSLPPDPPEKEVELEGPPLEGGRGLGVRGRHMMRPVGPPPAPPPPRPPPQELGRGNPFLLFVCVAMLLEQRECLLQHDLDYDDVAVHFDRLVRRHSLTRVLPRARALFADYLRSEVWDSEEVDEAAAESPQPS